MKKKTKLLRIDIYGGYSGDKKPDDDHKYSWRQYNFENVEQFKARVLDYVIDIIDELEEGDSNDED